MIFEQTGHDKPVDDFATEVFVGESEAVEQISGKAGGKNKLDGRLEQMIDDELDEDEEHVDDE